jgi:hypothetical protein
LFCKRYEKYFSKDLANDNARGLNGIEMSKLCIFSNDPNDPKESK